MPSQEWNDSQIENNTGNAPKIANRMKNGDTAAYCGNACRNLFGGLSGAGSLVVTAAVRRIASLTAISDRPHPVELAIDQFLRVPPGLVGGLAADLHVDQFGLERIVDDRVVRAEVGARVLLRGLGEDVDD